MSFKAGVYQGPSIRCDVPAAVEKIREIVQEASASEIDLVQFPELFLCGYDISAADTARCSVSLDGEELTAVRALALEYAVAVGVGYAERGPGGIVYNSCLVVDATGTVVLNYRKTHLWDPLMEGEKLVFTAGSDLPVAALYFPRSKTTITIGVLICFDCEFPEPARVLALKGATVVLVSTAICDDATPRVMIPCRAAENHMVFVYSNLSGPNNTFPSIFTNSNEVSTDGSTTGVVCYCGQSAVVAPNGDELVRASRSYSGLISANVDPSVYTEHKRRNDYLKERRPELYGCVVILPS